jgi:hypothetical protein
MSFIRKKLIHGNWYYYKVHTERKDGKVIQIHEKYLGPVIPKRLEKDIYDKYVEERIKERRSA